MELIKKQDVINKIIRLIHNDAVSIGDKLPSIRELKSRLNTTHATLQAAFNHLEKSGFIEKKHGSGSRLVKMPPKPEVEALNREHELPVLISPQRKELTFGNTEYVSHKIPFWNEVNALFASQRVDIDVDITEFTNHDAVHGDDRDLPDFMCLGNWAVNVLQQRDLLLNLSPWVSKFDLKADVKAMFAPYQHEGLFSLPFSTSVPVLLLNQKLLSAEDVSTLRSFNDTVDILNWCNSYMLKRGQTPYPFYSHPYHWLHNLGLNIFDYDGLLENLEKDPGIFTHLNDLNAEIKLFQSRSSYQLTLERESDFIKGLLPMCMNHACMLKDIEKSTHFPLEVLPLPIPDSVPDYRIDICIAIPKQCKDPDSAIAYLEFLLSSPAQELILEHSNGLPIDLSLVDDGSLTHAIDPNTVYGSEDFNLTQKINNAIDEVCFDMLLDGQSPEATHSKLIERIRILLEAFSRLPSQRIVS